MFLIGLILLFTGIITWVLHESVTSLVVGIIFTFLGLMMLIIDIASPMEEILVNSYTSNKVIESNIFFDNPKDIEVYSLKSKFIFCIIKDKEYSKIIVKDIENE